MPNPFTPEQISQILEEFFRVVGTRQYIGARYVPIFGRRDEDTIEWDNTAPYEPLTIVLYQGNSYTSRQYVPVGVEITNQEFWALTGNYNAQVEQYRRDVAAFDGRITQNATDIAAETTARTQADTALGDQITAEATTRAQADTALGDQITAEASARTQADTSLGDQITAETSARTAADVAINSRIDALIQPNKMLAFGDSWGNSSGEWPTEIAKLMGLTVDNYCISGARFPFAQELSSALAAHPAGQQDDIECAIVFGGVNNAATTLVTDFTPWDEFINTFREYFPNTRLYVFPMNVPTSLYAEPSFADSYITTFNSMQNAYAHFAMKHWDNVFIIPHSNFMLNNETSATLFNTDMLHPNAYGSKIVAHNMYNAINGRYQSYEIIPRATIPTGVTILRNAFVDQDGLHTPTLKVAKDALANDGEFLCYFRNYRVPNRIVIPFKVFSASNVLFQELTFLQMNAIYNATNPYFDIPFNTSSGINSDVLSGMRAGSYGVAESVLVPFVGNASITQ